MKRDARTPGRSIAWILLLGGAPALPASDVPVAGLLRMAWIAPELGSPEREAPATVLDVGSFALSAPAAQPFSKPAPAVSIAAAVPSTGTSLRERLAARAAASSSKPETLDRSTAPFWARYGPHHTATFYNTIRQIEEMAKAKAGNPSEPIGGYQDANSALKNASELPEKGYGWFVPKMIMNRGTNFGTDQMVFGLMETFAVMADLYPDGVFVRLEDIGKRTGGHLDPHLSHSTGRDADLALFGIGPNGKDVNPRVAYDAQGAADGGLRFDTARNWDFACTMMESHYFEVYFILIDQPLKDLLLRHAQERIDKSRDGAERDRLARLLKKAESAIRNGGPGHANHYHLRIR